MPKSLTPALFDITVRPLAPWSRIALIRFSGMPHRPKPDTMIEAPSGTSRTASAALFTTLFMGSRSWVHSGRRPGRLDDSSGARARRRTGRRKRERRAGRAELHAEPD